MRLIAKNCPRHICDVCFIDSGVAVDEATLLLKEAGKAIEDSDSAPSANLVMDAVDLVSLSEIANSMFYHCMS